MEKLVYVDRRNTNCNKWDGQQIWTFVYRSV